MIVISNPIAIANEISLIHSLFEAGLALFHVRKPDFSEIEMAQFVHQIKMDYRKNLVLHSHHELADEFGINRIHFSERERNNGIGNNFQKKIISTSTHAIEDFNALDTTFEYAFLSPVFKSISKENYLPEIDLFEALKLRTNFKTKVIGLGGIQADNITETLQNGFDDIALLGTIWNNENLLKQFEICQKIVLTCSP
ncbi:thiamine phosphate synthase [Flavobacterium sp. Fl-77]|uniref:Thiamine phosphate synthase n=1 Tax=Flavobacterium flavipigmentatum TaxID=2893884 RepID=A0AAJ2SJG1_9FLAO|nr:MULTISPECIES: thiamine phosphate synthase [unclassified Flavobacterium]MDX6183495.1 thiamine phosphate synthase [Flavobacterium sp. Fl-33]MDX6187103.1 thiamine phosphate synthase [Flavobacterium sp. Fl-77]UFH40165.1 thiamine phosphate synthase [Flavobacterium sp. F-70]